MVNADRESPEGATRDAGRAHGLGWGWLAALGAIGIVLGFVLFAWPPASLAVTATLVALWLLLVGVMQIIRGFGHGLTGGTRTVLILTGILSILLGLLAFRGFVRETSPLEAIWVLALLAAAGFVIGGTGMLVDAAGTRFWRGWNIIGGMTSLLMGLVLLLFPMDLEILAVVLGIFLMVYGAIFLLSALKARAVTTQV